MMPLCKTFKTASVAAVLIFLLAFTASAVTPPGVMNHQGRILVDGANYTGTGYFKFALVQTAEPFSVTSWSNDGTNVGEPAAAVPVDVVNGHYAVLLGDTSLTGMTEVIPASVFSGNADVSLRIWFSADGMTFEPLSPDRRLTTAAYAFSAAEIDGGSVKNPAFLGRTDASDLELKVNNVTALRLRPTGPSRVANLIGGFEGNQIDSGATGAVIAGGGAAGGLSNYITDAGSFSTISGGLGNQASNFGSTVGGGRSNNVSGMNATIAGGSGNQAIGLEAAVGGGFENVASGFYATIPGGLSNTASGQASFAAGRSAKALHDGTFVWSDSSTADFASTGEDQFLIRASGGVGIGTNDPQAALDVAGTVRASSFESSSGSPLTLAAFDDQPVEFQVNASRGFRLQPGSEVLNVFDQNSGVDSPSVVGGYFLNLIDAGTNGATIAGGGGNTYSNGELDEELPNRITIRGEFGTISGGRGNLVDDKGATVAGGEANIASGEFSTVSGGRDNEAFAPYSFAAGRGAKSIHEGAFVWADGTDADFASTADNQFAIRADGGVRIFDPTDPTLLLQSDGTNEPSGRLSLRQINNTGYDIVYDGVSDVLAFESFTSGTSGGSTLSLDLDGNIGVNTSDPQGNLHIASLGSVELILEADTNNLDETDQPSIRMSQDGGAISGSIGFFDGSNSFEIRTEDLPGGGTDLILAPDGLTRVIADQPGRAMFIENASASDQAGGVYIKLGATLPGPANDFILFINGNDNILGSIDGTGIGGVAYKTTSDRRLKQDIVDLPDALATVDKLQPREYAFRVAPEQKQAGFIAQEIAEIYPQATSGDPEGDVDEEPMMIDYSAFTPLLTGAVQELHGVVRAQQENIEALESENAALHERLLRLETALGVEPVN